MSNNVGRLFLLFSADPQPVEFIAPSLIVVLKRLSRKPTYVANINSVSRYYINFATASIHGLQAKG